MCKVSIILPSLNVEKYISECIESVLEQTLRDIEIICIDAGSTDGTWDILSEYALKDDRIRLVHSEIKSYGYQINLGISLAESDYIAIVETDDYVQLNMYEYLFRIAEETHADIIKADFDSFVSYPNGKTLFERRKLFGKDLELYNKLIDPRRMEFLYLGDTSIWKGIYRRAFLLENRIELHETRGAAFQDIGFIQQALSYAKNAYYSDQSFYRYRMDRLESSSYSVKCLAFARQEFQWLIEEKHILETTPCKKGFFGHMVNSLGGEAQKILPAIAYDVESEYFMPHYEWFVKLIKAEATEYFEYLSSIFDGFELLIEDIDDFVKKIKEDNQLKEAKNEKLNSLINYNSAVIFGTGVWGNQVLQTLYNKNITNIRFSDNNGTLWGCKVNEVEVIPPSELAKSNEAVPVIIANKYHSDEIKEQLLKLGVDKKRIIIY